MANVKWAKVLVLFVVDVQAERIDTEIQLGALLVSNVKVADTVHLKVLRDFQVLEHRLIPETMPRDR